MPAPPGTAIIAPVTTRPPVAAAPAQLLQLLGKRRKVGIGIDAVGRGDFAPLVGHAEQAGNGVILRLAGIVHAGADAAEEIADAGEGVLHGADRIGDELTGEHHRAQARLRQRLAEGVGVRHLFHPGQRIKLVLPHAHHLVALHGEAAVGRLQHVDAQQPVAAHRGQDGVVAADPLDAADLRRVEGRRALIGLGRRRRGRHEQQERGRRQCAQRGTQWKRHHIPPKQVTLSPLCPFRPSRRKPKKKPAITAHKRAATMPL